MRYNLGCNVGTVTVIDEFVKFGDLISIKIFDKSNWAVQIGLL